MQRKRSLLKLIAVGTLCLSSLASCSKKTSPETSSSEQISSSSSSSSSSSKELLPYDMSGVSFPDVTAVYDGKEHKAEIQGTLPQGVTVTYENNTLTDAGEKEATAHFHGDSDHQPIADKKAKLKITKAEAEGLLFSDKSFPYDGKAHTLAVEGTLPEGMSVSYSLKDSKGDAVTEAIEIGVYSVTASLVDANGNYKADTLYARMTIVKGSYDISGLTFPNKNVVYDGTEYQVEIEGTLPEGVTVAYTDNKRTDAGVSNATAVFGNPDEEHYNTIPEMHATLTVNKATILYSIESLTAVYDGKGHHAVPTKNNGDPLSADITVTYSYKDSAGNTVTEPTDAGTYAEKFTLTAANHNEVSEEISVTIEKADFDFSQTKFENAFFPYDGAEHTIAATGIPDGVTVTYQNNGRTASGFQTVKAQFSGDTKNHNAIPDMTATLGIVTLATSFATSPNGATTCQLERHISSETDLVLPSVINGLTLTALGSSAFYHDGTVKSVYIPKTVTSISLDSFVAATSLTSIEVDPENPNYSSKDGVLFNKDKTTLIAYPAGKTGVYSIPSFVKTVSDNAFSWNERFTSINLGSSVETIGKLAFTHCTSLTQIIFPDSVTSLGDSCFDYCPALTSITFGKGMKTISSSAFTGCYQIASYTVSDQNPNFQSEDGILFDKGEKTIISYPQGKTDTSYVIPSTVTAIGDNAFNNHLHLKSVTLPSGLLSIGDGAFNYNQLKSISFPSTLKTIGKNAFRSSSFDTAIVIPDSVTEIGDYAFEYGDSIPSISLGAGLETVGINPFAGNTGLTSFTISASNTHFEIQGGAVLLDKDNKRLISCLSLQTGAYSVPDTVETIGQDAFLKSGNIASVYLPDSVKTIEENAMEYCSNIKSITGGKGLVTLGKYCFNGTGITTFILSKTVTTIGGFTFYNCQMTALYCERTSKNTSWPLSWNEGAVSNTYWYSESSNTDGKHWHYVNDTPTIWIA